MKAGVKGESIAFGLGVTIPALLLLGFDMSVVRVMTVGTLGGLLGILMMIPLRRTLIVARHGELKYPEGTACAQVLIAAEASKADRHSMARIERRCAMHSAGSIRRSAPIGITAQRL